MKNIVITGTSRGIGLQLALIFAKNNYNVLAISRKISSELQTNKNIHNLSLDISDENSFNKIKKFIEDEWKSSVDIIIHNAGLLINKPFENLLYADFEKIYKVNVFAVAKLTQICIPFLQKNAHVVTISSMGGIQGSSKFSGLAAYSSSKGAVITLSEVLAEEHKEKGISFNVLALGAVNTEMLQEAFPGYIAPVSALEMANYIYNFAISGNKYYNGKVLQVSLSTP